MTDIYTFKRIEKKYRITESEKQKLLMLLKDYLIPDPHGKNTIASLYLDTPDRRLIRSSIDSKGSGYKEKLRIRSYGTPNEDSKVFFEIKKKYKGIVYKRRISLPLYKARRYLTDRIRPEESQIMNEIDYAMSFYNFPAPSMMVSYEREAYFVRDIPTLRITFDSNIRYREDDLSLADGSGGSAILPENEYILEIKTDGAMPLWLSHALSDLSILPQSFSKYGSSYLNTLKEGTK